MSIISGNAKPNHSVEEIKVEKLRENIVAEIASILKTKESHRILKILVQGETLNEKEGPLVQLRTILMESVAATLFTETGYQGSRLLCDCGTKAKFIRYDKKSINLLVGTVLINRALYHCQGCGRYIRPLDQQWQLPAGHNSEGIERITALLGAFMPFETAEKVLLETSGVYLSDTTIRTVTENIGAKMETIIQADIEKSQQTHLPEPKADVLAILADGTMVNTKDEQWKEVKVGAVASYTRVDEKELKLKQVTYTSSLGNIDTFRPRLWAEAYRRGAQGKEATLFLGDGSHWIWNLADELFPGAIQVLDYWHLCENVWKAAHELLFDEAERNSWAKKVTEHLRYGRIEQAISAIEALKTSKPEQTEKKEAVLGYIRNNKKRMDYPELESKGYPIGSGIIESACKRIVGARHKQAGMRWSKSGAQKMLNLSCFIHGNRWEGYWQGLRKAG